MTKQQTASQTLLNPADDTHGYAAGLYTGDYGSKARPQPGVPANAVGRDPASIVTGTIHNAQTLIHELQILKHLVVSAGVGLGSIGGASF